MNANSTVRYIGRLIHSPRVSATNLRTEVWNITRESIISEVVAKTKGRCFYCGEVLGTKDTNVDHFWPIAKGGTDEASNLFPCCRSCNSSKGSFTLEEWRMSRRLKIGRECLDLPTFSRPVIEWLGKRGVDVLDGIPDVAFWFEVEGFITPEGRCGNYQTPNWIIKEAERRLEAHRQDLIRFHIDEEAARQGVAPDDVREQCEAHHRASKEAEKAA